MKRSLGALACALSVAGSGAMADARGPTITGLRITVGAPVVPKPEVLRLRLDWSLAIARDYFGLAPDCGAARVGFTYLAEPVVGLAVPPKCHIAVSRTLRAYPVSTCYTVVHEYGHLLGLGHIEGTVMAEFAPKDPRTFTPCAPLIPSYERK